MTFEGIDLTKVRMLLIGSMWLKVSHIEEQKDNPFNLWIRSDKDYGFISKQSINGIIVDP